MTPKSETDPKASVLWDLLQRLSTRVDKIEERLSKNEQLDAKNIAELRGEIKGLRRDTEQLRVDVLDTVRMFNTNVWKLITKGAAVLLFLIGVIVAFAGIKITPALLSVLQGIGG